MAEYLIQGETLTGIADKIRPLLGLTGTMTPEQMQTNLTTEQANIAAALAALAEKGVEVPEGANSNALAGLIEAIEAGGEIEINGCKVLAGEYVSAEDMKASSLVTIFEQAFPALNPIAGLFYTPSAFIYDDRPFLSASGSGLATDAYATLGSQTGYTSSGSSTGYSDGFKLKYYNGKLVATMKLNSNLAVPAGRVYNWIILYKLGGTL